MEQLSSRIKMARIMSGFSMQELADKTGNAITKQSLSKYEKGLMKPTLENLNAISQALGVKIDYFLRKNQLELGEIKYRKQNKLPKKKQNEIREKTRDYLERYLEAEMLLSEPTEELVLDRYDVGDIEDIESIVMKVRNSWGLGKMPIYNVLEVLEQNGIKVLQLDEKIPHFSGMSTWVEEKIPVVVLSDMPIDRLRFTALHELGHLILNIENLSDKAQERICDRFAAAMLIPSESIRAELGTRRSRIHIKELVLVKSEYGISPQALLYRAKDLEIISERYFTGQIKFMRMSGMWNKEIGQYKGEEKPNRLLQLLFRGVSEEVVTASKAASLYSMKLSQFRRQINRVDASDCD